MDLNKVTNKHCAVKCSKSNKQIYVFLFFCVYCFHIFILAHMYARYNSHKLSSNEPSIKYTLIKVYLHNLRN